jgi:hypothetical protein
VEFTVVTYRGDGSAVHDFDLATIRIEIEAPHCHRAIIDSVWESQRHRDVPRGVVNATAYEDDTRGRDVVIQLGGYIAFHTSIVVHH